MTLAPPPPRLDAFSELTGIVARLDIKRRGLRLDDDRRAALGQFMTPAAIALRMAEMFEAQPTAVRLLDPGAGAGSLTAAYIAAACARPEPPAHIEVTAYELDTTLAKDLRATLADCSSAARAVGVQVDWEVIEADYIVDSVERMLQSWMAPPLNSFNAVILNPPYRKINVGSDTHSFLRAVGVDAPNLYAAFVAVAVRMLEPMGELVAITPRSFANGRYFRNFRRDLLSRLTFRRFHLYESRDRAFGDDGVLQENVIFHAVAGQVDKPLVISSSSGPDDDVTNRTISAAEVVLPDDAEQFIRLTPGRLESGIVEAITALPNTLEELGVSVSTGRVVDFRSLEHLRASPARGTAPLIYPAHLRMGAIRWPWPGRKPNAIVAGDATASLLVPPGTYVLVKRFTAKEERRRVVAAVITSQELADGPIGFENHLNYFHRAGGGLPLTLARGIAAFMNSSLVDGYLRQFSGHTQVNVTDLRSLRYPTIQQLQRLGSLAGAAVADQPLVDRLLDEEVLNMASGVGAIRARQKIDQAVDVLRALGLPKAQHNERSALSLLALADVRPDTDWSSATTPLRGVRPMMDWMREHYGKDYAENTRESIRRQTIHQFLDAGLIVSNPDDPNRPTNSGKTVYQLERGAVELLRAVGTSAWDAVLGEYRASSKALAERYREERDMRRIPIVVGNRKLTLTPGGQNVLVRHIVDDFLPRWVHGAKVLHVGDTGDKSAFVDEDGLRSAGIVFDEHGKFPDVVAIDTERDWLVLIEAVTSHGPVDPKRKEELRRVCRQAKLPLVFVTAFLSREAFAKYAHLIAWETEVWVASDPTHLTHFNGPRYLGPYQGAPSDAPSEPAGAPDQLAG